jgi:hypothetical protein
VPLGVTYDDGWRCTRRMNEGTLVAMELLWGFGFGVVEGEGGGN